MIEVPAYVETGAGITNYVPNNDSGKKDQPWEHVRTAKSFLANVLPENHALIYRWDFADSEEAREHAAVICAVACLITHLGQHQDITFASGKCLIDSGAVHTEGVWLPHEQRGGGWVAPQPGSLAAYQSRYQAWLRGEPKDNVSIPVRPVEYRPHNTISFDAPMALFEMWPKDDNGKLRHYYPHELRQPAGMVRHAMIEWMNAHQAFVQHYGASLTSSLIAGHDSQHAGSKQHDGAHIACVPIPSFNRDETADGLFRRVLVIGYGCKEGTARELFDSVTDGINGADLVDQIKGKVGYLKKAVLNDSVLRLFIGKGERVWRTVTPIILTGLMRRGRGAEVLIARALQQAGVQEADIQSVAVFSGPIVPKTVHALDYEIERNSYLAQTPRYHAEVVFKRPVAGALVVGRGRHCGFGLLMPCQYDAPNYPLIES